MSAVEGILVMGLFTLTDLEYTIAIHVDGMVFLVDHSEIPPNASFDDSHGDSIPLVRIDKGNVVSPMTI